MLLGLHGGRACQGDPAGPRDGEGAGYETARFPHYIPDVRRHRQRQCDQRPRDEQPLHWR